MGRGASVGSLSVLCTVKPPHTAGNHKINASKRERRSTSLFILSFQVRIWKITAVKSGFSITSTERCVSHSQNLQDRVRRVKRESRVARQKNLSAGLAGFIFISAQLKANFSIGRTALYHAGRTVYVLVHTVISTPLAEAKTGYEVWPCRRSPFSHHQSNHHVIFLLSHLGPAKTSRGNKG